jgi:hypothetical protein
MYLHQLIFKFVSDLQQVGGFLWVLLYRDVPKVFGHCDFLLYISCKTTFFKNIIPMSLNTNINYLSSNVLSLYCIFDVQNLVLCLNRELIKIIDYKFMLKLQCKTTFNSVFVDKKIIKIEQVDFGIMFLKNVVLHEIYSKKSQ